MRFFSKFVFICNLCFVLFVGMNILEIHNKAKGKTDVAIPLPFVENTVVVLGLLSLLVNAIFCLIMLVALVSKKRFKQIPRWLVIFNFIILLAEFYWFIIDK